MQTFKDDINAAHQRSSHDAASTASNHFADSDIFWIDHKLL
jgi:hypothetical protein